MKRSRRKFSASFMAKVALEAIKEQDSLQDISSKYEVHIAQITKWKREFLTNASAAFESSSNAVDSDKEKDKLYSKIGQFQVEVDFLKYVLDK
jgi:transposase